jgi:catechol 2,3-dioxygenase-like lactoylglutathione lyase family enzyme
MKRFHVNLSVADLDRSIEFYTTLFGAEPSVTKGDYAKWMLEDPRINFSMSTGTQHHGINHIGLQADTTEELDLIQSRLRHAEEVTVDQPDAKCCYASSTKTWVRDPDDVAWETFVTHGALTQYGEDTVPGEPQPTTNRDHCCSDSSSAAECCI